MEESSHADANQGSGQGIINAPDEAESSRNTNPFLIAGRLDALCGLFWVKSLLGSLCLVGLCFVMDQIHLSVFRIEHPR